MTSDPSAARPGIILARRAYLDDILGALDEVGVPVLEIECGNPEPNQVPPMALILAGTPAWLARIDALEGQSPEDVPGQLATATARASHVVLAPQADRGAYCAAMALAMEGGRVVLIDTIPAGLKPWRDWAVRAFPDAVILEGCSVPDWEQGYPPPPSDASQPAPKTKHRKPWKRAARSPIGKRLTSPTAEPHPLAVEPSVNSTRPDLTATA